MVQVSVIIPTYNERENIIKLIPSIDKNLSDYEYEIVVVDDSSPDGTAEAVRELANNYPVKAIVRPEKSGLSSAVVEGFKASCGKYIGVIDADLQHPPNYLKNFVLAVSNGQDIAIGSRYVKGGIIEEWSNYRSMVSKGAIMLSSPLTDVKDPMSGYFFFKRKVIENISFDPRGFKILLEILVKGSYKEIKEFPITLKNREKGKSKLDIKEYMNYLWLLCCLYGFKLKKIKNER
ncbi:MAG: polyprenol monophosphomannose synthase [Candidatus Methanoperedens sp.]|nr:polyprenol monophosphomannose synthase [Candidatus Methanoperedens sp.]